MSDNLDWDAEEHKIKGYITSSEGRKTRIAICESCESLNKFKMCAECGCFMPAKVWIKFIDCPKGKWVREEE
jgi:hypothetical protein